MPLSDCTLENSAGSDYPIVRENYVMQDITRRIVEETDGIHWCDIEEAHFTELRMSQITNALINKIISLLWSNVRERLKFRAYSHHF
jgi:hypothetical protein